MLSKEVSSTIFKVFGMARPGIEPRSRGLLANTLLTRPMSRLDFIIINKKKKRICRIEDFAVLADHREKLKESKKKDKYLDLARGLKKLWNMRVMVIPIVIVALGRVTKGLVLGLEDVKIRGRVETI